MVAVIMEVIGTLGSTVRNVTWGLEFGRLSRTGIVLSSEPEWGTVLSVCIPPHEVGAGHIVGKDLPESVSFDIGARQPLLFANPV